ncbi:MAG: hypothetical protein JNK25_10700 [Phycisphaerae bacterium]|nr:hypothetical protein [Phycisphaerae bacterium]
MRTRTLLTCGVLAVILAGTFALSPAAGPDPLAARIGRDCKVQFRRDYLGASCPTPVAYSTDVVNGSVLSLVGELTGVDESWVRIRTLRRETTEARANIRRDEFWIPRDAILLIQFDVQ